MAKLPRKTQKIFCSNPTSENQTSVFGTMKTANKQYSSDIEILQSNVAYEQGWKSATIASYKPFMEDFNTLNYINTSQLAYLFQQGVAEWDDGTTYYINSIVKAVTSAGDLKLYRSLTDDNINNNPTASDSIHWTLLTQTDDVANVDLSNLSAAGQLKFDNKVNLDAQNLNVTGKAYLSGLPMPSNRYINLTIHASGTTYTAPANGWVVFRALANANEPRMSLGKVINGESIPFTNIVSINNIYAGVFMPVRKDDIFEVGYNGFNITAPYSVLRFFYAEGN